MQYIGKLMRGTDAEPIREAVADMQLGRAKDALALHEAERWRAELIADDDAADALDGRASRRPTLQQLRSLIRAARKDAAAGARAAQRARLPRAVPVHQASAQTASSTEPDRRRFDRVRIGLVSISDRASSGVYEDKGIPALQDWLPRALRNPIAWETAADPRRAGRHQRRRCASWSTCARCDLVLTTGGTGPAPRDVTPEATLAVADKVMPGFGEQMRQISLRFVPTAILSRQVAVIRGKALIINLPGQPKSIAETLEGLPRRRSRRCTASSPRCPTAST